MGDIENAGAADDQVTRERLYAQYHEELTVKQNSNSEAYDQNILTLSAAGLGLSVTFISDVVPIAEIGCRTALIQSWFMFGGAIIATLVSYQCSQQAIKRADNDAHAYYLGRDESFLRRSNPWNTANTLLGYASGLLFVLAVIWTAYFVATNLPPPKPKQAAAETAAPHPPEFRAAQQETTKPASSTPNLNPPKP